MLSPHKLVWTVLSKEATPYPYPFIKAPAQLNLNGNRVLRKGTTHRTTAKTEKLSRTKVLGGLGVPLKWRELYQGACECMKLLIRDRGGIFFPPQNPPYSV